MKRNVDLTENRVFTTPEQPTGLIKLLLDAIKVRKPWDFENNPKTLTSDSDLGMQSKQWRSFAYDSDDICDWCGQDRGKKPWARNRCNCYSMTYTPRIPWKF